MTEVDLWGAEWGGAEWGGGNSAGFGCWPKALRRAVRTHGAALRERGRREAELREEGAWLREWEWL